MSSFAVNRPRSPGAQSARIALRVLVWMWIVFGLLPFVLNAMIRPHYGQLVARAPWVQPSLQGVQVALALATVGTVLSQWIWFRAPELKKRMYPEAKLAVKPKWFFAVAAWIIFVAAYAGHVWQSSFVESIGLMLPGTTAVLRGTIIRYDAVRPVRLTFVLDKDQGGIYTVVFRDGRLRDSNRPPSFLSKWAPHLTERAQFTIYESAVGRTLIAAQSLEDRNEHAGW